jgi:hypothetical protein
MGFLSRTFEVVPAGREGDFIDIDGELNELLRWALAPRNPHRGAPTYPPQRPEGPHP